MKQPFPCYGVIPARFASQRFPGKPLADIGGRPMFWHVYQRAREALDTVVLATDDARIAAAASRLDVPCIMTRPDHPSGSDRVYEAACRMEVEADAVVVNIQGDEPALDPGLLHELVSPFVDSNVHVSTLGTVITAERALASNQVKIVLAQNNDALYFSRAVIPYARDAQTPVDYVGHIGVYAFRMAALERFVQLPPSRLEHIEKLEQLRFIENGIPVRVVLSQRQSHGVDTPEDLERVRALMAAQE